MIEEIVNIEPVLLLTPPPIDQTQCQAWRACAAMTYIMLLYVVKVKINLNDYQAFLYNIIYTCTIYIDTIDSSRVYVLC